MPPRPKTATVAPGSTLAVLSTAPMPVVTPQPSRQTFSSGASLRIFASGDLRQHGVLGEGGGAHVVVDRLAASWRSAMVPSGIRPLPWVARMALAEVGLAGAAELALAALGCVERDHVVARLQRGDAGAHLLDDGAALVPEDRPGRGLRDPARRACRHRCGRRRWPRCAPAPRRPWAARRRSPRFRADGWRPRQRRRGT